MTKSTVDATSQSGQNLFISISDSEPYSEQEQERLGRLVTGGRQALEDEDWIRAIRRAYYAKGLLTEGR